MSYSAGPKSSRPGASGHSRNSFGGDWNKWLLANRMSRLPRVGGSCPSRSILVSGATRSKTRTGGRRRTWDRTPLGSWLRDFASEPAVTRARSDCLRHQYTIHRLRGDATVPRGSAPIPRSAPEQREFRRVRTGPLGALRPAAQSGFLQSPPRRKSRASFMCMVYRYQELTPKRPFNDPLTMRRNGLWAKGNWPILFM